MSNHREHRDPSSPAIAVVGVSALFPGSTDQRGFWRDIFEGRDQIEEVPPEYWLLEDYYDPDPAATDKTYGNRGAFLRAVPFDSMAFGVPPNLVSQTDTSQLLALIMAQKVLEDAFQGSFQHKDKSRISVILGATGTTELVVHLGSRLQRPIWLNALREKGIAEDEAQAICERIADSYVPWTEASFPGLLGNVIAGRIANKFDLGGTNCVVDAACASSLSALSMGLSELYLGMSDMVIVGGVDTLNDILMYMCFSKTPALSATGDCRPFSDQADGTILGEGVGMLALRRLDDAERDGNRIYAVIRGIGSSSDGQGTAVYAPKASGQAHALRRAYEQAGYSPRTVELLEAHGTATKAGDVAEFTGSSSVFAGADGSDKQWCAIGSIKSQIGHTKGAAGAASLIKAVLALHHKVLPPTIKVEQPNSKLAIEESPFYVNTTARPWVRDAAHPRRASVSSFGFGGSNFHVTLEEYTGNHERQDQNRPSPTELFLISGAKAEDIVDTCQQLTQGFEDAGSFQFLARETQKVFQVSDVFRLAIVAQDISDLQTKLDAAAQAIQNDPAAAQRSPTGWYYSGNAQTRTDDKLGFLFPGQGSQYVGMGADLALAFPESLAIWDEVANYQIEQEEKLHPVVFPLPAFTDEDRAAQETHLRATEKAQPAIGVTSLSQLAILSALTVTPDCVGGHSFGEVTALYAAGALDRESFFSVAHRRGELMAETAAARPGAMTAILHAEDQITELLTSWNTGVVIANHNGPDQVVVSGIESAMEDTEARLRQAGIKFHRLPVATAFHSPMVRPATEPFRTFLDHVTVKSPQIPVYSNSTATVYPSGIEEVRATLAEQIALPVRFTEQIEAMYAAGVRTFLEVGPGTVLGSLVRRCLGDRPHSTISLDRRGQHGLTSLWHGLGQLAVAGVSMQLASLWDGVDCGDDPRQYEAPKLAINIRGVNHAKPYPPAGGAAELPTPNIARKEAPHTMSNHSSQPTVHSFASTQPDVHEPNVNGKPARVQVLAESQGTGTVHAPAPTLDGTSGSPAEHTQSPAQFMSNNESLQWIGAFQELQKQTAEAHMAFLRVSEQSMKSLESMLTGSSTTNGAAPPPAHSSNMPAAALMPTSPTPIATNGHVNSELIVPAPDPVRPLEIPEAAAPAPNFQPTQNATRLSPATSQPAGNHVASTLVVQTPAAEETISALSLREMMLDVVTEKTGYPAEMLELGMSLDTDLGIDSIKRVEILAAMRERVPDLPEFDMGEMAGLNTLGEIADYIENGLLVLPGLLTSETPTTADQPADHNTAPVQDLRTLMLEVVTEKTGYPAEMLELGMSLDTDLGIDSIKRVEILAAMRERVPELPEFDMGEMASLNTLGEIADYIETGLVARPGILASEPPTAADRSVVHSTERAQDLRTMMLEVVTEKTGYPAEMLELGMSLDTDLGIDSIKRVEILAAMREQVPDLPEFDMGEMASLNTLGEIADYIESGNQPAHTGQQVSPVPGPAVLAQDLPDVSSADIIGRYVLEVVPRPAPGLAPPYLLDGTLVYVTDDGGGIAPALTAALKKVGVDAVICSDVPADARSVICLAGLRHMTDDAEALAANKEAFLVATKIAEGFESEGGLFVTVQNTNGDFGLGSHNGGHAWLGGLTGLAKTAAQEWPKAIVRSLDLAQEKPSEDDTAPVPLSTQELAERLAVELLTGGMELEIGLPWDGRRIGLASVERSADGGEEVVNESSVIVASGGGRGVAAAALLELARVARPKLAILGRTVLEEEPSFVRSLHDDAALNAALLANAKEKGQKLTPRALRAASDKIQAVRAIRSTLKALREAGSEVEYYSCDVTDEDATMSASQAIRAKWGPITGFVHAAGVIADKRLSEKTAEDFRHVFGTKIDGFRSLLAATQNDPLSLICLFSSVAARTGNAGQSDYAMANEVLNRVAQAEHKQRRGSGCVVKSIGWGPWESGMVTPSLRTKFQELGVPLISLAAGAKSFVAEIQQASPGEVEVLIGGPPQQAPLVNPTMVQSARPAVYDVAVDARSHPYLHSHRIKGAVVLPLVLVQEWFLRAANAGSGQPFFAKCQDLRVFKGIPLAAFDEHTTRLRIQIQPQPQNPSVLEATLYDTAGVARYAAHMAENTLLAEQNALPTLDPEWRTVEWHGTELYGSKLFHGPDFAALHAVDHIGDTGAQGTLIGSGNLGWGSEPWLTDPALLDGGLQLALIWGYEHLGRSTLPTALHEFILYHPGRIGDRVLPKRQVRCILKGSTLAQSGTRSDLWFVDDSTGEILAEIRGLEMYASNDTPLVSGADTDAL